MALKRSAIFEFIFFGFNERVVFVFNASALFVRRDLAMNDTTTSDTSLKINMTWLICPKSLIKTKHLGSIRWHNGLLLEERKVILATFIFFLAYQNTKDYVQDQGRNLQGGRALLV